MSPAPIGRLGGRKRVSDATLVETVRVVQFTGSSRKAAVQLGLSYKTVYWRVKEAEKRGIDIGGAIGPPGVRTPDRGISHPCLHFRSECPRCWMERAFFLLVRTRGKIQDGILLHDIEECLWLWPGPVSVPDPADPPDPVALLSPGTPSPGPGSEKKTETMKLLLTAGSMTGMVPV